MPIVTILAVEGRTIEQKRGLAKDITEAVMKNFKVSAEQVEVIIQEMKRENFAQAGKLSADR
ncbi:MAG: 4-oxalocrotonate tautomerase [Dehalococcoidales bacterium]|nr:4-oxalocrotonate tautomerase [Dehalococcoidales bacterium]